MSKSMPIDAALPAGVSPRRRIAFPVAVGERELRLDLFRGAGAVADLHRPPAAQHPDLVHHPQLRLQRRHRDFHFHIRLYRRLRLRPGHARPWHHRRQRAHLQARVADLCRAHVAVHDLPCRNFLCRDELRESAVRRRDEHARFPQAARRHHRPGAAAEIPARQHGRAAALHRPDGVPAADPVADAPQADFTLALSVRFTL